MQIAHARQPFPVPRGLTIDDVLAGHGKRGTGTPSPETTSTGRTREELIADGSVDLERAHAEARVRPSIGVMSQSRGVPRLRVRSR